MRVLKLAILSTALVAGGAAAASAQTYQPLPGQTGTPADIVTVPLGVAGSVAGATLGTAGAIVGAPLGVQPGYEGRSAFGGGYGYPGSVPYINGDYQHLNEPAAPAGGVSETGRKTGVAENPQLGQ